MWKYFPMTQFFEERELHNHCICDRMTLDARGAQKKEKSTGREIVAES
jgi:hypothetical protein